MTPPLSKVEKMQAKARLRERQGALTMACKSKNGPAIIKAYEEFRRLEQKQPACIFAQTLQGIMTEDVTGFRDVNEVLMHGERIFEAAMQVTRPTESLLCIMCRLSTRIHPPIEAVQKAEKYFKMIGTLGVKPKIRTFLPLFELHGELGHSDEVEQLYAELVNMHEGPQNTEIANRSEDDDLKLWEIVMACRLNAWRRAGGDADRRDKILRDICELCPKFTNFPRLPETLLSVFEGYKEKCSDNGIGLRWRASPTMVSRDGLCSFTQTLLRRVEQTEEELNELRSKVTRLACEGTSPKIKEQWDNWVQDADNLPFWDAVIDGANVGHHNQNWECGTFSFQQIDDIVNKLQSQGKKACVVLRRHWLEERTDLTLGGKKVPRKRALAQIEDASSPTPRSAPSVGENNHTKSLDAERDQRRTTDDGNTSCHGAENGFGTSPSHTTMPHLMPHLTPQDATASSSSTSSGTDVSMSPQCKKRSEEDVIMEVASNAEERDVLREEDRRAKELRSIARKWEAHGNLLISPQSLNDDWVVMYVCITMTLQALRNGHKPVYLVSNDYMRDHFWRMRQEPGLVLWREAHLTNYRIVYPERHIIPNSTKNVLTIYPPLPFSARSQWSAHGSTWHFAIPINPPSLSSASLALEKSTHLKKEGNEDEINATGVVVEPQDIPVVPLVDDADEGVKVEAWKWVVVQKEQPGS